MDGDITLSFLGGRLIVPDDYDQKLVTAVWLTFHEPVDIKEVLLALHEGGYTPESLITGNKRTKPSKGG